MGQKGRTVSSSGTQEVKDDVLPPTLLLQRLQVLTTALLAATATVTHGGTKSDRSCLGCERKASHTMDGVCDCPCHKTRALLAVIAAETPWGL